MLPVRNTLQLPPPPPPSSSSSLARLPGTWNQGILVVRQRRGRKCTGNNNQWSCCIGVWRAVPAPPCCPTYFDRTPLPVLPSSSSNPPLVPPFLLLLLRPPFLHYFRGYRRATLCPSFFHLDAAGWNSARRLCKRDWSTRFSRVSGLFIPSFLPRPFLRIDDQFRRKS